jgi:hypothetical protein
MNYSNRAARLLLAALVSAVATLTFVLPAAAHSNRAASRDAFTGVWVGVESPVGDGSTDLMAISGPSSDGSRKWLYYETNASGYCSGGPLSAAGAANAVGNLLTVTVTFTHCFNDSPGSIPPPFDITMTSTGNGQIDWNGVIFTRAGSQDR